MPAMNTAQDGLAKVVQANVSATTYTAAAVNSSTVGTVVYQDDTPDAPNLIHVTPFTTQSSGTPGFRLIGWRRYLQSSGSWGYVPTVLADFSPTFTTGSVPTGTIDGTSYNFFSAVTQATGQPAALLFSPATAGASSTEVASVVVDAVGCQIVTVQFKVSTGTATGMGILWATL